MYGHMYLEALDGNSGTRVLGGSDLMERFLEVNSALMRALEVTAAEFPGFPSQVILFSVEAGQTVKRKRY